MRLYPLLSRRAALAALCSPRLVGAVAVEVANDPVRAPPKWHPGHYVFVGQAAIAPDYVLPQFRGVQRLYAWSDLEPAEGAYDFSEVERDLALLSRAGKQLVIQVQYKAFGRDARRVPAYIQGPAYGGGVYRASSGAWDPVIWNERVGRRLDALFARLGQTYDAAPGLEAVVLPETSTSAAVGARSQPGVDAFSLPAYVSALKQRMAALREAFPRTVVIQYLNYPVSALDELAAFMRERGVGLGGPDVYPRESPLADPRAGVYRLYPALSGLVPLGAAVQGPNYSVAAKKRSHAFDRGLDRSSVPTTPEEEQPIPVREHLRLARAVLKLNYLFWSAHPRANFELVKQMLTEPDLAGDPAGGLMTAVPIKAFLA